MINLKVGNTAFLVDSHKTRVRTYPSLGYHVRQADVVVVAVGRKEIIKGDMIKPGAVVIDCGINPEPDATKKSGMKLWGDVQYSEAKKVISKLPRFCIGLCNRKL